MDCVDGKVVCGGTLGRVHFFFNEEEGEED